MQKFKVGVIGCGRITSVYKNAFAQMTDTLEIVIAVDKDLSRAQAFAAHFPSCTASDKLEDLLAQPLDVVHILTPHHLHHDHAIACLNAGFHVLCEKPIAISMKDAQEMCEAAKTSGRSLGIIFQNRYIEGI